MPTLTTQDAEQSVTDARASYSKASSQLDTLKARILTDGPDAVTAQELAQAAAHVEHAKLTIQHAVAELERAQGDERQRQLNELKAEILTTAGEPDAALAAMRQIEEAATYLVATCSSRQRNVAQWMAAMQKAGVPAAVGHQDEDGHAGLGWSVASMAGGDAVLVDDRRIGPINPGMLIAAAVARGCQAAGQSTGSLAPVLAVDGVGPVVSDPDAWLRKRY